MAAELSQPSGFTASTERTRARERAFLNRYYGVSRFVYDATRKYYLLGRDPTLLQLLAEPWQSLVEVGVGTGRNLRWLHARRPDAAYGGLEPCDEMRDHAQPRVPWARVVDSFAEQADYPSVLGKAPDRILFSYSLSMVSDPATAMDRALAGLAPGGEVVVVDFGEFGGLPAAVRIPFRRFLSTFHVEPKEPATLGLHPHSTTQGPLGYYYSARFVVP